MKNSDNTYNCDFSLAKNLKEEEIIHLRIPLKYKPNEHGYLDSNYKKDENGAFYAELPEVNDGEPEVLELDMSLSGASNFINQILHYITDDTDYMSDEGFTIRFELERYLAIQQSLRNRDRKIFGISIDATKGKN